MEADLLLLGSRGKGPASSVSPLVPIALLPEPSLTLASTLLPDLLSELFYFWPIYQPLFSGLHSASSCLAVPHLVSDTCIVCVLLIVPCPSQWVPLSHYSLTPICWPALCHQRLCHCSPHLYSLLFSTPAMALSPLPGSPPCPGLS